MPATSLRAQRARVGALTRFRDAADPELVQARSRLSEDAFVAAVERALQNAPPIRPEIRDRVIALLATAGSAPHSPGPSRTGAQ